MDRNTLRNNLTSQLIEYIENFIKDNNSHLLPSMLTNWQIPISLNNLETIITYLNSNNSETPTKTRLTVGSTVKTYLIKTNESSSAMALRMQEDWDKTVDNIPNKGTGIVNPTNEQIQTSKDAYFAWCVKHANAVTNLHGSYDDEVWSVFGGWTANGTPSQVGVGITDVITFDRKDGTTANFTNHTYQLYITEY